MAESFRSFANAEQDLLIVEFVRSGRTMVFALSSDGEGNAIVENLTGALAVAAGRQPTAHIDNLELDFARLPVDGVVAITGEREVDASGAAYLRSLAGTVGITSILDDTRRRTLRVQAVRGEEAR